jgi:hypothetical protein
LKEIKIILDNDHAKCVHQMMEDTGVESVQRLIEIAFGHLEWLIKQVQTGRVICSMNKEASQYKELDSPALAYARESQESRSFGKTLEENERLRSLNQAISDLDPDNPHPR